MLFSILLLGTFESSANLWNFSVEKVLIDKNWLLRSPLIRHISVPFIDQWLGKNVCVASWEGLSARPKATGDESAIKKHFSYTRIVLKDNLVARLLIARVLIARVEFLVITRKFIYKYSLLWLSLVKGLVSGSCIAGFCYCLHFVQIQQIAIKIPCLVHFW
jgi:hypothetical protein